MNEFLILFIISLISGILLTLKAIHTKDLGILGGAAGRFCLSLVALMMLFNLATMATLFWAVIITLLGDVINFVVYAFTYDLKPKNQKLEEANYKLFCVMENSSMALFTINLSGNIEYVNDAFANLMGLDKCSLIGRNFYALFNIDKLQFEYELESILVYKNRRYTVKGFRTKNGHDTITGSIS